MRSLISVPDFAGGLNRGAHPLRLAANQMVDIRNFYVDGDSLAPRKGSRRLSKSSAAYGETTDNDEYNLFSFIGYHEPVAEEMMFIFNVLNRRPPFGPFPVAFTSGFSKLQNGQGLYALVDLTRRDNSRGKHFPPNAKMTFRQVRGNWFAASDRGGYLFRGDSTGYEIAGISAPTTAPTIVDGGVGNMTISTYYVVYTYYNSSTTDESHYSPVSAGLALTPSGRTIAVSGIVPSSDAQADKVRVYVTLPGQTDQYFFAAELPAGTTSTIIDVTPDTAGDPVDDDNALPPDDVRDFEFWDNRSFVTDGDYVIPSKYLRYQTFIADSPGIPVYSEDGTKIKSLYAWSRNRLVVGKPNRVAILKPDGTGDYIPTSISEYRGMRSKHAMRAVGETLIYYDGFTFVRSDSESTPVDIADQQLKDILRDIPEEFRDDLVAEISPKQNLYVVTIPLARTVTAESDDYYKDRTITLAYNYRKGGWSIFDYDATNNPTFIANAYDEEGNCHLFGILQGTYKAFAELLEPYSDLDMLSAITRSFKTKAFSNSESATAAIELQCARLLATQQGITADVSVYRDLNTTPYETRDLYLYGLGSPWKWTPLNTRGVRSTMLQFGYSCSDPVPDDFRISALELEVSTRPTQRLDVIQ